MSSAPKPPDLDPVYDMLRAGRDDDAISALQALSRSAAPRYELLLQLGLAYNRVGAPQEAVVALKSALRLDPAAALPWTGIGIAYGHMSQHARAVDALQTAIRLGDDSGHAHLNLARALALVNRAAEAVHMARAAHARLPDNAAAAYGVVLALKAWAEDGANPVPVQTRADARAANRLFLQQHGTTPLAEEAATLLSHWPDDTAPPTAAPVLRSDVMQALQQAIATYEQLHDAAGSRRAVAAVVFEITLLVANGIDATSVERRYPLESLPGRDYSGLELAAYLYAGARKLTIAVESGIDYAAEYDAVLRQQTPR